MTVRDDGPYKGLDVLCRGRSVRRPDCVYLVDFGRAWKPAPAARTIFTYFKFFKGDKL